MNLNNITDELLLCDTKNLVSQERQLVTVILHHLAEVQRRRLFCQVGCSSLFQYCTEELKYSEAQAQQKISAMRLMLEVPELEEKLATGQISVTNVAQAQSFFRQEIKASKIVLPLEKKKEVLKKLESTSTRQGQKILLSLSSQPRAPQEKERPVSAVLTEIRFTADEELLGKMRRLKGLMAHKNANMSYSELIHKLCELGLEKLDPVRKAKRTQRRAAKPVTECEKESAASGARSGGASNEELIRKDSDIETKQDSFWHRTVRDNTTKKMDQVTGCGQKGRKSAKKRAISAAVKHQVWLKAKGSCENCGTEHALQIDHRTPFALGGGSGVDNLRVLCRNCNQRAAIKAFGAKKMREYLHG